MTRTLFAGGHVYDGTLADPAPGEVVVEAGRIVEVGAGLDGDEAVDCTGHFVSPGFFDTHVHVTFDGPDTLRDRADAVQPAVLHARPNLRRTLDDRHHSVRDASGADLGIKEAVEPG